MSTAQLRHLWETGAAVAAVVLARLCAKPLAAAERSFGKIARKRALAVLLVGLFALVGRSALLPVAGIPQPMIHDEFSYLLAADTFSHGRLTNPPHRMWIHFETFHVIFQPTYSSMYPVAQGLVLAAGQVLTGYPWVGVWLSVAAMCAGICWMLQAWMPPRWALLGGVLAVLQYGLFEYWINSYWGGAVAALGGALVLGAWPRIRRKFRLRDALWMGLGLAILANSRPYEGMVMCIPVALALGAWMFSKKGPPLRVSLARVVFPLAVVMALTVGAMGYYNWRVTGNALEMPYQVDLKMYYPEPMFLWQPLKPLPEYHHALMRQHFQGWLIPSYELKRSSFVGFLEAAYDRGNYFWFHINYGMLIPLFMLPWILKDRRFRLLIVACTVTTAAVLAEAVPYLPHYSAPMTCVILAVVLQGMRHLRTWGRHTHRAGKTLVQAIVVFSVFSAAINIVATARRIPIGDLPFRDHTPRSAVKAEMEKLPGKQLAIVQYLPNHNMHDEWVYNEADIDAAKIAWARDMGAAKNEELLRYFRDRQTWLVQPDVYPARVSSYHGR